MPIYEFECRAHGVFEEPRSMSLASAAAQCPECGDDAPRILSLPAVAELPRALVKARDRSEKSRHDPSVVKRESTAKEAPRRQAAAGRPWMIGHG